MAKPHDVAFSICAEQGEVLVDGLGIAFALTPDAAAELSERLLHSSCEAQGQLIELERITRHRPSSDA